jgi:hypothetical protein
MTTRAEAIWMQRRRMPTHFDDFGRNLYLREPNTMMRQMLASASMVLAVGALALACKAGGVGDPCIPNDEFSPKYAGATEDGAQIEDRSFQCETRVCLVKHFRGRVTCPFGNSEGRDGPLLAEAYDGEDKDYCLVPGTTEKVNADVRVNSQCSSRVGQVYCSCRCAGDDSAAKYCDCPDGYVCAKVTEPLDPTLMAPGDKYCIKKGDTATDGYACPKTFGCHEVAGGCGFTENAYQF